MSCFWVGINQFYSTNNSGLDNRTERTRHRINYEATYHKIFDRVNKEITKGQTKHLILMLGTTLVGWLWRRHSDRLSETGLVGNDLDKSHYDSNQVAGPNGCFWGAGKQIRSGNRDPGWSRWPLVWALPVFCWLFPGQLKIIKWLDDDQISTANNQERNWLVTALQQISLQNSVRITILGGDVHLAAVGQFYSNKKLSIPIHNDHRYMANVTMKIITY